MLRLPEGWSSPEVIEDELDVDGLVVRRAGISSTCGGEEACGSAAEVGASPVARAQFELLERIAVAEQRRETSFVLRDETDAVVGSAALADVFPVSADPDRWRYSSSSGIALHSSWRNACTRATWELVERDRILRAWHGETVPRAFELAETGLPILATRSYDWRAVELPGPQLASGDDTEVVVVGVFGLPKTDAAPFALGFGARPAKRDALEAAAREALQFLSFMWGEPPLDENPHVEPTGMRHLDEFQVRGRHEVIRRWLDGRHAVYHPGRGRRPLAAPRFVDLTPSWMLGGLRVAKALCDGAEVLTFGESPSSAHLPQNLRIHPIP